MFLLELIKPVLMLEFLLVIAVLSTIYLIFICNSSRHSFKYNNYPY